MERINGLLAGIALLFLIHFPGCGSGDNNSTTSAGGSSSVTPGNGISGRVTTAGGGLDNVTLTLTGDASAISATDPQGNYQFSGLTNGSYNVIPNKAGFVFTPSSRTVSFAGQGITGIDFTGATIFSKAYEKTGENYCFQAIQQAPDGGYIAAGYTGNPEDASGRSWVVKLTPSGDIFWQKSYFVSGMSPKGGAFEAIQATSDGGYIAAGSLVSRYHWLTYSATNWDGWVIKLDTSGNVQWGKSYPRHSEATPTEDRRYEDTFYSVRQTSDAGYLLTGTIQSPSYRRGYVVKLDLAGNFQWAKDYRSRYEGYFSPPASTDLLLKSGEQTPDGGYILGGWRTVLRLNPLGEIVWQKYYEDGELKAIQQALDGGFIIAGNVDLGSKAWIVKLDSAGKDLWQKTYVHPDDSYRVYSIFTLSDGGYIIFGAKCVSASECRRWVAKLDATGEIQWQKAYTYGGPIPISPRTFDGGYIAAGYMSQLIDPYTLRYKAWVLKTDPEGTLSSQTESSNATVQEINVAAMEDFALANPFSYPSSTTAVSSVDTAAVSADLPF